MSGCVDSWVSAGSTDVGMVRRQNQDCFLNRPDLRIWIVADGMGGHERGDIASQMLCGAFDQIPREGSLASVVDYIDDRVLEVNNKLLNLFLSTDINSIVGSTIVVLVARGPYAVCLWAGDSRLYRLRGTSMVQLTDDHSLVEQSNVITRAVGAGEDLILDIDAYELREGDRFLLCSDGLNKELDDREISRLLSSVKCSTACSKKLVENARNAGGTDNITAVVADYDSSARHLDVPGNEYTL